MKKQTSSTLLILFSIIGFLLIASGIGLTLILNRLYYLVLLTIGIIISIVALALSSRTPQKSTNPFEDTVESSHEVIQEKSRDIEIEQTETSKRVVSEESPKFIQPTDLKKYTIELEIDTKTSEALLRLTEKMIEHHLLTNNPSYNEENTSNSDIFKEAFKAIPVVGVVKNRFNNYNILAGITHDDVEIIGTIKEHDLELIQTIHPKTQNIRAIITGGKFKTPDNTEHTQAHRVQVTFYV